MAVLFLALGPMTFMQPLAAEITKRQAVPPGPSQQMVEVGLQPHLARSANVRYADGAWQRQGSWGPFLLAAAWEKGCCR